MDLALQVIDVRLKTVLTCLQRSGSFGYFLFQKKVNDL